MNNPIHALLILAKDPSSQAPQDDKVQPPQAVEKDADFVISSPSEGFPESELASFWGFL